MPLERIVALATDYDRTLTDVERLEPVPEALAALGRAKRAGKRVIVISGRDVAHLGARLGRVADAIVAENGCLVRGPDGLVAPLGGAAWDLQAIRAALARLGAEVEHGEVLASVDVAHEPLVREALDRAGIRADLIRNRDRVMVLPQGVDKATGLVTACRLIGVPPERVAAAGDGENDVPLLKAAGYGIAVDNAVDELKKVADHVTREPGGHGLARWIDEHWL